MTGDQILQQLARIGFANVTAFFDQHGQLRHPQDLAPEAQAAIAAIEIVTRRAAGTGRGAPVQYVAKIKTRDAVRALQQLAKLVGLAPGAEAAARPETIIFPPGSHIKVE